jgi:hypothetical protein
VRFCLAACACLARQKELAGPSWPPRAQQKGPGDKPGPIGHSGTSPCGFSAPRRPLPTPGYDYGYDYPGRPLGSGPSFYQDQAMAGSSSTAAVSSASSRCV